MRLIKKYKWRLLACAILYIGGGTGFAVVQEEGPLWAKIILGICCFAGIIITVNTTNKTN
jgi:hypothetical protein